MSIRLEKVRAALADYEHPLLNFAAEEAGDGVSVVDVVITLKHPVDDIEPYAFGLHPREIDHAQFAWEFQRQLYDCLHDYMIELFTRNPQQSQQKDR